MISRYIYYLENKNTLFNLYIYKYFIYKLLRGYHTTPASLCIEIANNGSTQN